MTDRTDNLADLKARLQDELTEEALFAFSCAFLETEIIIPSTFRMSDADMDMLLSAKQGACVRWEGPQYEPVPVEWDEKTWLSVFAEKSAMPAEYRNSCIHMDGLSAVRLAHRDGKFAGIMLDPGEDFLPVPLDYLDELIRLIHNEGEENGA